VKKIFISFFLLTHLFSSSCRASAYEYATEGLAYAFLLVGSARQLYSHVATEKILTTYFKQLKNERMLHFIEQECLHVTEKPVRVYVGHGHHYQFELKGQAAFTVGENILVISPECYQMLETLFSKSSLTAQDEMTLNMFRFIFQHEATHMKNGDAKNRIKMGLAITLAKVIIFELSKKVMSFRYSQALSVFVLNLAGSVIASLIAQREEYIADDVRTEAALVGGRQLLESMIMLKGLNPEIAAKEMCDLAHPSSENRLKNLQLKHA
jgi:hypothetical protein